MLKKDSQYQLKEIIITGLIFVLPFIMPFFYYPYLSYYNDSVTLMLLSVFVLIFLNIKSTVKIPYSAFFLLSLSIYWFIQPLFTTPPIYQDNIRVSLLWLLLSIVSLVISNIRQTLSVKWYVNIISWAIIIGCCIQSLVIFLQALDVAKYLLWLLQYKDSKTVNGLMGQRNNLGHYLMWGIAAIAYQVSSCKTARTKRVLFFSGLMILLAIGLVSSRTIMLYSGCLIVLSSIIYAYKLISLSDNIKTHLPKSVIIMSALTIFSQWIMPKINTFFGLSSTSSGLTRVLSQSTDNYRLIEWQKAWDIFLDNSVFGVGWQGFAFQSFILDSNYVDKDFIQQSGFPTHSHNIIFQLLAEMGIVGFSMVLLPIILFSFWVVKKLHKPEYYFVVCIISISAIHSMLEYPLWYIWFLSAVILLLSISSKDVLLFQFKNSSFCNFMDSTVKLFATSVCSIVIGLFCFYTYNTNSIIINNQGKVSLETARREAMFNTANNVPLLKKYEYLRVAHGLNVIHQEYTPSDKEALQYLLKAYPDSYLIAQYALINYQEGNIEDAIYFLEKSFDKYPRKIPEFIRLIENHKDEYVHILPLTKEKCQYYSNQKAYENFYKSVNCQLE